MTLVFGLGVVGTALVRVFAFHLLGFVVAISVNHATGASLLSWANFKHWSPAQVLDVMVLMPLKEEVLYRAILLSRLVNRLPDSVIFVCLWRDARFDWFT